jgi:hypothetical protein
MADEAESGSASNDAVADRVTDPEKGLAVGAAVLTKTLEENLHKVVACILTNIEDMHLPSAKLLVDLAARLEAKKEVPVEEYVSLAEVLWQSFKEEQEEHEEDELETRTGE